jgi:hypothetical protein
MDVSCSFIGCLSPIASLQVLILLHFQWFLYFSALLGLSNINLVNSSLRGNFAGINHEQAQRWKLGKAMYMLVWLLYLSGFAGKQYLKPSNGGMGDLHPMVYFWDFVFSLPDWLVCP